MKALGEGGHVREWRAIVAQINGESTRVFMTMLLGNAATADRVSGLVIYKWGLAPSISAIMQPPLFFTVSSSRSTRGLVSRSPGNTIVAYF